MGCCYTTRGGLSRFSMARNVDHIKEHYTHMYNFQGLIFRRGLPFVVEVPCESAKRLDCKNLRVSLTATGVNPVSFRLDKSGNVSDRNGWVYDASILMSDCKTLIIKLNSPPNAIVGEYKMTIYYDGDIVGTSKFILFFNPWCQADDVFMSMEDDREEYILNDSTKIYMGTEKFIIPKDWNLGQFEPGCIEATVFLLNKMSSAKRSSAVDVSRFMSAIINSNDDNGVLVGNWSGKYADGTSPTAWTGSVEILSKYASTHYPVKFGQCWVFSGVLCTVLRCCGIPSRCITNYGSLHDSDGSLKWEIYLDANFQPINNGGDSCWNFHCWNEAWMTRSDLGSSHDGWQVVDATPQERSGGLFRLGPASKYAVKTGQVRCNYDVGFVYAEVNADKVYYLKQADGSFKVYQVKQGELGRCVMTKKKLSDQGENITGEYKCPSPLLMESLIDEEHTTLRNNEESENRKLCIDINLPNCIMLMEELKGTITIRGMTDNSPTTVTTDITLMSYTGKNICKLYENTEKVMESDCRYRFTVDKDKILYSVTEEFPFIKCKVYCYDKNNDELSCEEKIIPVKTPDLNIDHIPDVCKVGTAISAVISASNAINRPLTHAKLHVKFTDDKEHTIRIGKINPGEKFTQTVLFCPKTLGSKKIYVSLESKECCGFTNCAQFRAVP